MFTGEDGGLLVAERAGAGGGFQEVGEGHVLLPYGVRSFSTAVMRED